MDFVTFRVIRENATKIFYYPLHLPQAKEKKISIRVTTSVLAGPGCYPMIITQLVIYMGSALSLSLSLSLYTSIWGIRKGSPRWGRKRCQLNRLLASYIMQYPIFRRVLFRPGSWACTQVKSFANGLHLHK